MKNLKNLFSLAFLCFCCGLLMWNCGGDGVLFSIEDDKRLGMQTDSILEADPAYNILEESQHPDAYAYLNDMKDRILTTGEVKYKDEFLWELHIIHDDSTLNAFATPGGYIYVYTGLIHFLDDASSLAGVLGHEIAHADNRHSSKQLQKTYGVSLLLSVLLGENLSVLQNIATSLASLSFSRSDETDADNSSVRYLCETEFEADGAANFFQKLIDLGQSNNGPTFLSTHPGPDDRVENIQEMADEKECGVEMASPTINNISYEQFKALLP